MGMKITFVNPNTEQEADKYLPKILAEAVSNKIAREIDVRASVPNLLEKRWTSNGRYER